MLATAGALRTHSEMSETELAALKALLRGGRLNGTHLEVGTAAGGTLREMISTYPREATPKFVVVDTFEYFPGQRAAVEQNLRSIGVDPDSVTFRTGKSYDAVFDALAAGERYDFILIDARHDAFRVMQDLTWARMLSPRGYLVFHDYDGAHRGVMWAADAFAGANPNYRRVSLTDSLLVMRKHQASPRPEVLAHELAAAYAVWVWHRLGKWMRKTLGEPRHLANSTR